MTIPLLTIKSALKVDYDDDDRELTRLREAAMSLISRNTGLALEVQDSTLYLVEWRDTTFPVQPFQSVASVKYTTGAVLTTMPTTDYWIDRSDALPVLRFLEQPGRDEGTAILVSYSVGYANLPPEVVHACISLIGHWYNNPEASQPISMSTVPLGLQYILESITTKAAIR
jgi:uncharacterized phiE125 gp8 family phage protein